VCVETIATIPSYLAGDRRAGASMKLCRFVVDGSRPRCGRVEDGRVIEVSSRTVLEYLESPGDDIAEFAIGDVRLRAPVDTPPSVRDFSGFEAHAVRASALRGQTPPPEWYDEPRFYFSNPAAISHPGDVVTFPPDALEWDYELEVAAVIGADAEIAGYTIMNDWSARDVQRREMKVGLGPAKGKDFATTLGPWLVTPDEIGDFEVDMLARVNGEERSRGNMRDMYHGWPAIRDQAAHATRLVAGDVLGSGTVGSGCILEHGDGRWLTAGDVVELEVTGIGILRNTVAVAVPAATVSGE
jgi:fumarylacetoacetate (FAA) hydrolase